MSDEQGDPSSSHPGYCVTLTLCLPRDAISVPVIRHLVRFALDEVGVVRHITSDVEVALTEACANVLNHAGPGDAYNASVTIGPDQCELRIVDVGHGFDHNTISRPTDNDDHLSAERGRGLGLMRALVDNVELVSAPEKGTLVRLVKDLAFEERAPARQLLFQALHRSPSAHAAAPD